MKKIFLGIFATLFVFNSNAQTIYPDSTEYLSPFVFGHNLEHTRSAVNHGLSAQMLRNRKFAGKPSRNEGIADQWFGIGGDKTFYMLTEVNTYTKHICLPKMVRTNELRSQIIENMADGHTAGIGQRELYLSNGTEYKLRTVTIVTKPIKLKIEFTDRSGEKVYATHQLSLQPDNDWVVNEFEMKSMAKDTDACVRYTFSEKGELKFGALSMMPKDNFHGMRSDVVANLKAIGPRLLRWPGGNFAGEYRWKDGLLPADERGPLYAYDPIETQPHTYGYDFHEISTDDFIALCREVGAEPLITINPVWGSPKESAEWVEYCNGPADSPYGRKRAERGHIEPYNVKFWSLGNEMGYGHMEGPKRASEYAKMAGAHADSMLVVTPDLNLFNSGPYPNDNWAQNSAAVLADKAKYVSVHEYACPGAGFTSSGYHYTNEEDIRKTYEAIIGNTTNFYNRAINMRKCLDKTGKTDLMISFDEWNQWHAWYRPSCVGEGIFAIRTLHMFMSLSNKLNMPVVCYFQPVGEGAIIIYPETSRLTANGQMFQIAKEHQDGRICKIDGNDDFSTMATVKSDTLTVTLVNAEYDKERIFSFNLKGDLLSSNLYCSDDIRPYTYFEKVQLPVNQTKKNISMTLPAHSVAIFKMKIKK